jgi:hypothetical protein
VVRYRADHWAPTCYIVAVAVDFNNHFTDLKVSKRRNVQ